MKRVLATVAVLILLATGCGGDDEEPATTGGPTSTEAPVQGGTLNVETPATNEKSFTAPGEINGGVVTMTFKNNGKLKHEAFLLGIGDRPEEEALRAFAPVIKEDGAPIPEFLKAGGGVFEVRPGQTGTSSITVPAGRYLITCNLTDADSQEDQGEEEGERPQLPVHFEQGMRKLLTVTSGAAEPSALPQGDGVIGAKEYAFDVPALTAGKKQLVLRNDGPKEIHMAAFLEFPAGVDEAGAQRALQSFAQAESAGTPPPPGTPEPTEGAFGGVLDVGRAQTFEADLKAGHTYAVACFIPDRAGGPPHVAKGMVKTFIVR